MQPHHCTIARRSPSRHQEAHSSVPSALQARTQRGRRTIMPVYASSPKEQDAICIQSWSGPRCVSTSLMYAFAQRPDCEVVDEPLYAHYLQLTGALRPYRDQVGALLRQPAEARVPRSLVAMSGPAASRV